MASPASPNPSWDEASGKNDNISTGISWFPNAKLFQALQSEGRANSLRKKPAVPHPPPSAGLGPEGWQSNACTQTRPLKTRQTATKKMWRNQLPPAFTVQLAEEQGRRRSWSQRPKPVCIIYPGGRDSAQVLESSGAGGWLSNCNGELQHQKASSETKRLPAAS